MTQVENPCFSEGHKFELNKTPRYVKDSNQIKRTFIVVKGVAREFHSEMERIYVKETLINLSSCACIAAPVIAILWPSEWKLISAVVVGLLSLTLLYPPFGSPWRPHRHSDVPYNRGGI